ncbi:hypothetical protein MM300_19165 [Evansella sp. LMS18]|jgi:hypothetical protein|uniref:hypothetical protein n=1 Tax=Evansella sp. LMS18 TaxID=2924033 RepID=UPI0020CFFBE3|nr:hypothetical protein [Evansella sp. LMS18]UTR09977.1 hypothetical protein MM300_19165 [Evansella sp. LMS18]
MKQILDVYSYISAGAIALLALLFFLKGSPLAMFHYILPFLFIILLSRGITNIVYKAKIITGTVLVVFAFLPLYGFFTGVNL